MLGVVSSSPTLAQRVVVSQEISISDDSRYEIFGGPAGQVVLYRDSPAGVELSAFNDKMEQVWSRDLSLDRSRPSPIGALMSRGEVVVFYTYRRDRGLFLKMHRYSDAGNLNDSLSIGELTGDFQTANFSLHYDSQGQYAILTQQKDLSTWAVLAVEVATGRLLYQHLVTIAADMAETETEPFVDASGNVYFWNQTNNRRSRLEEHTISISRIGIEGQTSNIELPLPKTLVFDLEIGVDEVNKQVVLGGYYAENPDEAAGVLLIRLDNTLTGQPEVMTEPFTQALVESVDPKDRRAEGVSNLDALDLVFRQDGSALIIGEQRRATLRTVGGRGGYFGATVKTDYLYEDIVLSMVGKADESTSTASWHEVLPKKQFSQDDGAAFSGYFIAWTPRQLRLIYNDEVRSGGTVSEYTLDGTGAIQRHSIMNTEYQNLWLRHEAGIQVSGTDIVIPSEKRNRLRLVRLSYGG